MDVIWRELALASIAFLQLLALFGIGYIIQRIDSQAKRSAKQDVALAQHELRLERVEKFCGIERQKPSEIS